MPHDEFVVLCREGGFQQTHLDAIATEIGRCIVDEDEERLRNCSNLLREADKVARGDAARMQCIAVLGRVLHGAEAAQRRAKEVAGFRAMSKHQKDVLELLEGAVLTFDEVEIDSGFGRAYVSYILAVLTEQKLVDQTDSGTGWTVYTTSPRGRAALAAIRSA